MNNRLKINIEAIPQNLHRYFTLGDYWEDEDGGLQVRVSDIGDEYCQLAIAIHEIVEWYLLKKKGIKEPDVMAFDIQFEKEVLEGKHKDIEGPGDHPDAPYKNEHRFAENIERQIILGLGMDWFEYEKVINEYLEMNPNNG